MISVEFLRGTLFWIAVVVLPGDLQMLTPMTIIAANGWLSARWIRTNDDRPYNNQLK